MLRNILLGLGFFVALLPHIGLPSSWYSAISSVSGLAIVFLLILTRRPAFRASEGSANSSEISSSNRPESLHVERKETEDRRDVHVEREIVVDTERITQTPTTEVVVEKKVTVERRRRKKSEDVASHLNVS